MSKTRKLVGLYMVICMAAITGIVYMFCTLGSEKAMIEDFELVQQENGNWDNEIVKDLEIKIQYYLGNGVKANFTYNDGEVFDIETEDDSWRDSRMFFEEGYGASVDEYMEYIENEKNGVRLGEDRIIYCENDGWEMYYVLKLEETENDILDITTGCVQFEENRLARLDNSLVKEAGDKIYLFHGGNLYVTSKEELLKIETHMDIDIARMKADSMGLKPVYSWAEEKEWLMCSDFIFDKGQYLVLVGVSSDNDDSYNIHVQVIDANTGEVIDTKEQIMELDETTVRNNVSMQDEYKEHVNIDKIASDYIKCNMITREYSLVTTTQICGYQDMIKIDYEYNQEGRMSGIKLSNIDVTTENKEYISTMIDTCQSEDGTIYVCYLEGIRGRERQYTDRWARRMIVDGKTWGFEENRDYGSYLNYYQDENPINYWFNGVGIRAYKDGKMVYWGYLESEISKLFAESIEGVMKCSSPYSSNREDLVDIEMNVVA